MSKVTFDSYYKYQFFFKDETGDVYYTDGDSAEIYRFSVTPEMEMTESNGRYYIDGVEVEKV